MDPMSERLGGRWWSSIPLQDPSYSMENRGGSASKSAITSSCASDICLLTGSLFSTKKWSVALARPPPFPVMRRRRGWWRQRAFALVRAFVGVAAAAETVRRNVKERCSLVVVLFCHTCYYRHTPLGNPIVVMNSDPLFR
eukprot:scaffold957_cov322-Pavlova_lutheri.AAC.7